MKSKKKRITVYWTKAKNVCNLWVDINPDFSMRQYAKKDLATDLILVSKLLITYINEFFKKNELINIDEVLLPLKELKKEDSEFDKYIKIEQFAKNCARLDEIQLYVIKNAAMDILKKLKIKAPGRTLKTIQKLIENDDFIIYNKRM